MKHPLRKIREELELTQQEFSKKFKTPQGTLSKLERGKLRPDINLLFRLKDFVDLDTFITEVRKFKTK